MCGKGYELTLFLFTDIIVVAKVSQGLIISGLELPLFVFYRGKRPKEWE